MKKKTIQPITKKHRFRRWLRRLFGVEPRQSKIFADGIGDALDEMHTVPTGDLPPATKKASVHLYYSVEEAALLFDLLHSEMEELMSLNTKDKLSKEPLFDQEQRDYLHRVMKFTAEQLKVLSKYANVGDIEG